MAEMLLTAMKEGKIEALIGRAPEFYGPDLTQSITNSLVFNRVKADKKPSFQLALQYYVL